jgi:hypothetical protein
LASTKLLRIRSSCCNCYHFLFSFIFSSNVVKKTCFVCQEAVARLEEMKKSIEAKVALRQSNLNPERPGSLCYENFLGLFNCLVVTEMDKLTWQCLVLLNFF